MPKFAVIIAAAGQGNRFGGKEKKPFAKLDGRPLFLRAIELFVNRDDVCQVILAVAPKDLQHVKEKFGPNLGFMGVQLAEGGDPRWQTVRNALRQVTEDAEYVAVHDAARVCTSSAMIDAVFAEASKSGAAILAAPISGTLKRVSPDRIIEQTVARTELYEAQTPQVFKREILTAAFDAIPEEGIDATDEAQIVELSGQTITVATSDMSNIKITFTGDVAFAAAILKSRPKLKAAGPRGPFEEAQW